jgi:hypothetical protein
MKMTILVIIVPSQSRTVNEPHNDGEERIFCTFSYHWIFLRKPCLDLNRIHSSVHNDYE